MAHFWARSAGSLISSRWCLLIWSGLRPAISQQYPSSRTWSHRLLSGLEYFSVDPAVHLQKCWSQTAGQIARRVNEFGVRQLHVFPKPPLQWVHLLAFADECHQSHWSSHSWADGAYLICLTWWLQTSACWSSIVDCHAASEMWQHKLVFEPFISILDATSFFYQWRVHMDLCEIANYILPHEQATEKQKGGDFVILSCLVQYLPFSELEMD